MILPDLGAGLVAQMKSLREKNCKLGFFLFLLNLNFDQLAVWASESRILDGRGLQALEADRRGLGHRPRDPRGVPEDQLQGLDVPGGYEVAASALILLDSEGKFHPKKMNNLYLFHFASQSISNLPFWPNLTYFPP